MATTTFEGFSVSHAGILDGTTGAESAAIYGVRDGTIAVDTGNFDNTGDDAVLSSWFWFNYATVTITAGFVPFSTVALLSGSTIVSSGTAPNDYYALPLWNVKSLNQPTKPVLIRVPSKDSNGVVRIMDFVLYKVQFMPINFTGPSYKNGLVIDYSGRALISSVDEKGATLTENAIGRMVNAPAGQNNLI